MKTATATETYRTLTQISRREDFATVVWWGCGLAFVITMLIALGGVFPPDSLTDPAGTSRVQ